MSAAQFLRADLDDLPLYAPAEAPDPARVIKLDANENNYGPSPRALAALTQMRTWQYYGVQDRLRAALARYVGLAVDNIVVTNGGDEGIDLLLAATLAPGAAVIDCPPSFEMYRIYTRVNRGRVLEAPRRDDFSLDVAAVMRRCVAERARVIMLASPNNPDGGMLARADLLRLLDLPALIVLDEAYVEFAGESAVDLLARYENLALVRTFSKWAGLAGLRVGYLVLPPALAQGVHKIRSPFNINAAGLVAALASLADVDYLMANVRALVAERERMASALAQLGFLQPLPSHTNFILCRVGGRDAHGVKEELARRDILIRAFQSPPMREYVRITVGTPEQNARLLQALEAMR